MIEIGRKNKDVIAIHDLKSDLFLKKTMEVDFLNM